MCEKQYNSVLSIPRRDILSLTFPVNSKLDIVCATPPRLHDCFGWVDTEYVDVHEAIWFLSGYFKGEIIYCYYAGHAQGVI